MCDSSVTNTLLIVRFPNSIESVQEFIQRSWIDKNNIHFAIVDDEDNYVGTVSLKNINFIDRNAEYAIVIHKEYWGKEFASFATSEIIKYGFKKLNLNKIYLNVQASNLRAVRFYEKYGFCKEGVFTKHIFLNGEYTDLCWYCIFNK